MQRPNVIRPSWIAFGWFIAAAVTALILLALESVRMLEPATTTARVWVAASLAIGFFVGGYVAGARVGTAPIVHGIAIGLFSVVVWLGANLLGELTGTTAWSELSAMDAGLLIFLQAVAAVVGARIGARRSPTVVA